MKVISYFVLILLAAIILTSCPAPDDSIESTANIAAVESLGFSSASDPGDSGILTLLEFSETLTMIYANNSTSITFPTGVDDLGTETLTTMFFMAETEVTNELIVAVYQWAYDNGRFSSTVSDPNGLNEDTAKHGGQELIDLDDPYCLTLYDYHDSGIFQVGIENRPVTNVTWYGAVMFCNWLTEMRDGNTDNLIYTDIDTTWDTSETTENVTKTGYRLPSGDEWEYTARYRGSSNTNVVDGYSNPYYTQGDSASGAFADFNNETACMAVAVYNDNQGQGFVSEVKSLGASSVNSLGLYDMSGNVYELCSTFDIEGGSWSSVTAENLQIGYGNWGFPDSAFNFLGFRLCRTAD